MNPELPHAKQDLNNQRLEILEYARQHKIQVDDFVAVTVSSRKTSKQRRIDELLEKLEDSDTLIVTELSRLGRSTSEVSIIGSKCSARSEWWSSSRTWICARTAI